MDKKLVAMRLEAAQLKFTSDGILDEKNCNIPTLLVIPCDDGLYKPIRVVLVFREGFLNTITVEGVDWAPPPLGPLGPVAILLALMDGGASPRNAGEVPVDEQGIVELQASKAYFAEGRLVRFAPPATVRVRAEDML